MEYGQDVVDLLLAAVPEFRRDYEEHLRDMDGELLLHVLFGDLTRFVVAAEAAGDEPLVERSLRAIERLIAEGDEKTQELVAVSFVENIAWEDDPVTSEVRSHLPSRLAAELQAQRDWRPQ